MNISRFLIRFFGAATVLAATLAATLSFAPVSTAAPVKTAPVSTTDIAPKTTERAAGCRRVCFGSIAVNTKTGISAWATNYATKHRAKHAAKKRCKKASNGAGKCRTAVWARNACMAVAYRVHHRQLVEWQGRWDNRLRAAKRKAKRAVRGPGKEKIWETACTAN